MSEGDLQPPSPLPVIEYESAADEPSGPRPWWVYAVVGVYVLLVLALVVFVPVFVWWLGVGFDSQPGPIIVVSSVEAALILCGASLMLTPVRLIRRRPVTRRSIWVPIVCSGILSAALIFGASIALAELCKFGSDAVFYGIIAGSIVVWVSWSTIFILIARREPGRVGLMLHRWLIAGSVLELLVAVPSHIIVRRRNDCCGGIATGTGICLGAGVAIMSFGPTVLLLYYRRRKRLLGK